MEFGQIIKRKDVGTVTNTNQLARGTGCRYLEVMSSHVPNVVIAIQWRRKIPANLHKGRLLIDYMNMPND